MWAGVRSAVPADEVQKLAEQLGVTLTAKELTKAMKSMDADGSGQVGAAGYCNIAARVRPY